MSFFIVLVVGFFYMPCALLLQSTSIPAYVPSDLMTYYNKSDAGTFRDALVAGAKQGAKPKQKFDYAMCHRSDSVAMGKKCLNSGKDSVFEAVNVSFPVPEKYLAAPKGHGDTEKNTLVMKNAKNCVVYGAGLDQDSKFEDEMAANGCEVHAFDCTVPEDRFKGHKFHFHRWCIGTPGNQNYSNSQYTDGSDLKFKTLDETVKELGHSTIDLLKMDIEGFEYGVIEKEILKGNTLPVQLAFELHTEESSNRFAPEENTKGKGYNEVSQLFLSLFDKGYRVISKQVNFWDKACAEFVVLNVDKLEK